jgi:Amt family ammonium transporter
MLIPLAIAGLALVNAGLTRSRGAAHSALSSLCVVAVAVLAYGALGTAIHGVEGQPGVSLLIAGKPWDILGAGRMFQRSVQFDTLNKGALVLLYQLFAVALCALIPVAGGAERWRITATAASTAMLAGIIYPLFSHWVWGGGWLAQLSIRDAGGAGVIQTTGGITALAVAWLLGTRPGKFTPDGIPTAMPGHNAVVVLFGSLLAFIGWAALSAAGGMLFYGSSMGAVLLALLNTLLAAAGGGLASLVTTRLRYGKPDASLAANGWVGALVAISAGAPFYKPSAAILIGIVAGVLVVFGMEVVEARMRVDDPPGAISVHAVCGIWGLLSVGMFAEFGPSQFLAQLLGVGTLLGFMLPLAYASNALLNRFLPYRVDPLGERQGMDLFELGAGAYPDFVTHRDEFMRR